MVLPAATLAQTGRRLSGGGRTRPSRAASRSQVDGTGRRGRTDLLYCIPIHAGPDGADAREQLTPVVLHLGDNPSGRGPVLRLILEALVRGMRMA